MGRPVGETGAPQLGVYQPPPPFIRIWVQMQGSGLSQKKQSSKKGKGLLLEKKQSIQFNYINRRHTLKTDFTKINQ